MQLALTLALAATLAGCVAPQRFQPPLQPPQVQAAPQQPRAGQQKDLGGPYTREREDREFGRQP
jgi:hypothetical protein